MIEMFWWLLVGHMVGDFWAQGEAMARGKSRKFSMPGEAGFFPPWPYWLSAHALIHGGAVALATQSVSLGVAEAVAHGVIDFGKCEGWYGFHTDQALHVVCKVAWCLLLGPTAALAAS